MHLVKQSLKLFMGAALGMGLLAPSMAQSFTDCAVPTVTTESGPIKKSLYVVGTFPGANWLHVPARKMSFKGNGVYQVVVDEKAGNVKFQVATVNWSPQFTVKGLSMTAGTEAPFIVGGFEKDTAVTLPADGKYVWSIQIDDSQKPVKGMVAACK